ncbi:MAG TPA: DUF393 domain-containing protein [Solirubrobacteraceae bacterium]|nr:DUF393 domain-containing protein [Solirubrobacteraceae bacterium]
MARAELSPVVVLYDADCGFCRWAMAWVVRHDPDRALVPVPIQSPLGGELLADLSPEERLRAAHTVTGDGMRHSGGAAAADVLSALPSTRLLGRLAHLWPGAAAVLYRVLAARRADLGRLVGSEARRSADALLQATRVTTAAELGDRSRPDT